MASPSDSFRRVCGEDVQVRGGIPRYSASQPTKLSGFGRESPWVKRTRPAREARRIASAGPNRISHGPRGHTDDRARGQSRRGKLSNETGRRRSPVGCHPALRRFLVGRRGPVRTRRWKYDWRKPGASGHSKRHPGSGSDWRSSLTRRDGTGKNWSARYHELTAGTSGLIMGLRRDSRNAPRGGSFGQERAFSRSVRAEDRPV